jgi:hypothetical protein
VRGYVRTAADDGAESKHYAMKTEPRRHFVLLLHAKPGYIVVLYVNLVLIALQTSM